MKNSFPRSSKASFVCYTLAAAICALHNSPAIAEERFKVNFGLMLDGENPLAGNTDCLIGERCQIVETSTLNVSLTINIAGDGGQNVATIDCSPQPCSFASGMAKATVKNKDQLDLYKGTDGMDVLLVSKPRNQLGRISFKFFP